MSSLREVKDRIASVRSTLKITSAMKLVASSKLRRAQRAIESLRPYEEALTGILAAASEGFAPPGLAPDSASLSSAAEASGADVSRGQDYEGFSSETVAGGPSELWSSEGATQGVSGGTPPVPWGCRGIIGEAVHRTVILAFAGNSSMCGAFNSNIIKQALRVAEDAGGEVEFWSFGRKMSEALRKAGKPAARVYDSLIGSPSSVQAAAISDELRGLYDNGTVGRIVLVYNRFVSIGKQLPISETFLPLGGMPGQAGDEAKRDDQAAQTYIFEPSRHELLEALVPQVLQLRLYAALLDSIAAEHAARMVAMQAATDNGEELLSELTLEYNKGRQQKITAEILDLVAGEA